jgi:hypothetical protein
MIRLYPPAWRRRYGAELAALIAAQPPSFRTSVDLLAGAADAWLNPQSSTAAATAHVQGDKPMVSKLLQLRSCGYGPEVTRADNVKAAAVILGGTLAIVAAVTAAVSRYGNNEYFESAMSMGWLVPFLFSQHFTTYKGRPARVQALLIGLPTVFIVAILFGSAWLNAN